MKAGAWCWMLVFAGCGTSVGVYPYRVMNDDCLCEQFQVADTQASVTYTFSAVYSLDSAIRTKITVSVQNNDRDTLDLSLAYVKIVSRNIPYRYNGKYLPVTITSIPPGDQRTLSLAGEVDNLQQRDPWLAIAGEKLIVTLKGMRIRGKPLAMQTIQFIPKNPKLSQ
jgi:hypothetical protein